MIIEMPVNYSMIVFVISMFVLVANVISSIFVARNRKSNIAFYAIAALSIAGMVGSLVASSSIENEANRNFASKLASEYDGAQSSKNLHKIKEDLMEKGETATKFTRNGVETDVFIKKAYSDDKLKMDLKFTVFEEGSLYSNSDKAN